MGNKTKEKKDYGKLPIDASPIFKSILENSRVAGIFVMDINGTILRANPGALDYFGYSEEDVIGKNFSLLFTKEDKSISMPENELKNAVETGSGVDDNFIVHKNGTYIWCHGESILTKDDEGNIYIVKIVFDIDKQRRLEQALFKKNNDLSNFVYTTSHDLKSPINNIAGLIEIFGEHKEITEKFSQEIQLIKTSIEKFRNMLNDLSEIGRFQEEENKSVVPEVQFEEIYEEVKWALTEEIKNSNATLYSDFSASPVIRFSKKNLRSIFYNLISNAIKFRSPERLPEIKVSAAKINHDWILLKVQDNGLGIKDEDKNKVFALYGRLNTSMSGSGIGLAIVSRIVDNNGGNIEIDSEPGKGCTFKIYFKV